MDTTVQDYFTDGIEIVRSTAYEAEKSYGGLDLDVAFHPVGSLCCKIGRAGSRKVYKDVVQVGYGLYRKVMRRYVSRCRTTCSVPLRTWIIHHR